MIFENYFKQILFNFHQHEFYIITLNISASLKKLGLLKTLAFDFKLN